MALIAVPVGFVAGLFGIGGGLITVPFLFYIFGSLGINPEYIMHLAVGTSFAIIIPTSAASVLTHHKFNAVNFEIVKSYGIFVILGVIFGTIFAATLKTKTLVSFLCNYNIFIKYLFIIIKRKGKKHCPQDKTLPKNYFRFFGWFYFCTNGNWGSCYECANIEIFWIFNKQSHW